MCQFSSGEGAWKGLNDDRICVLFIFSSWLVGR